MNKRALTLCVLVLLASLPAMTSAFAATGPAIGMMSKHRGAYWGGALLTIRGHGFSQVQAVRFGTTTAYSVQVVSDSTIKVRVFRAIRELREIFFKLSNEKEPCNVKRSVNNLRIM